VLSFYAKACSQNVKTKSKPLKRKSETPDPESYAQKEGGLMIYKRPNKAAIAPESPSAAVLIRRSPASLFLVAEAEAVEFRPPTEAWDPAQVNLPLMTLLEPFSALKVEQELVMSENDWMLKAPRLSLSAGSVTLVKLPYMSVAPVTVARAGKVTTVRRVLFWTWRPPEMDLRSGIEMLVKAVLVLMARVPPTAVKLGARMLSKELSYKPNEPVVLASDGIEMVGQLRKVKF